MTRARNSANLASQGNLFVDITNDRTGIGSVVPAQNLHVAGTAGFHADTTFVGDLYNATWDRSDNTLKFVENAKLKFGDQFSIYKSSSHAIIDHEFQSGSYLRIGSANGVIIGSPLSHNQTLMRGYVNGAAELYYAGAKKLETTTYGTNTTGTAVNDGLVVAGVATVTTMNVTGVLTYDDVTNVDSVGIVTARQGFRATGGTTLLGATSSGFTPHNTNWATNSALRLLGNFGGGLTFNDNNNNGYSMYINTSGQNFFIKNGAVGGSLKTSIKCVKDGAVELYHNNNLRVQTDTSSTIFRGSSGIRVYGDAGQNQNGQISIHPQGNAVYSNLLFYNAAGNTYASIIGHAGQTLFFTGGTNGPLRFRVNGSGFHSFQDGNTDRVRITVGGEVNIGGNFTQTTVPLCVTTDANDYGIRLMTGSNVVCEILNNDSAGNSEIRGYYNNNSGTRGEGYRLEANGETFFNPGGNSGLSITSNGNVVVSQTLYITDRIQHYGDNDTTIRFPAADQIQLETNGVQWFNINSTGAFNLGNNSVAGAKVYIKNGNDDANNTNALALDIQGAWMRIGDAILGNETYNNGIGIKFHNSGTVHWTAGVLSSGFYISNTSNNGNELFPSTRTDALFLSSTGNATFSNNVTVSGNLGVTGTTTLTDDLNVDSGTLFVDVSSNRIGINQSSPSTNLDVVGNASFSGGLTVNSNLTVSGTCSLGQTVSITGTNPRLQFVDTNHNSDYSIYGSNGRFTIYDDTNSADRFKLESNGYVNIGTGTASQQLTVQNSAQHCLVRIVGKNNSDVGVDFGDPDNDDIGRIRYQNSDDSMSLMTNTVVRLRIDSSGRVMIGGGSSPSQVGDGRLIVYSTDRLHPAIKPAGTSSNFANGWTLLGDNYQSDESQINLGVSYSSSGLVLSRGVKVSGSQDDVYLSSQDSYATRPCAIKLDYLGAFNFLTTETNATVATDSAVSLTEVFKIDRVGNVYQKISGRNLYLGSSGQLRIGVQSNGDPNIEAVSGDLKIMDNGSVITQVRSDGLENFQHIYPQTNSSKDLGKSSYRWRNVYASGLIQNLFTTAATATQAEFRNEHNVYGGGVRFKSNNTYGTVEIINYNGTASGSFYNSTGGWHWSSNMQFHGAVSPFQDSSHDLGSNAKRWRTLYADTINVSASGNNTNGTVANFRGGVYNQINIAHANNSGWGLLLTNTDQSTYGSNAGYHFSSNTSVNSPCAVVNVNSDALHFATGNASRWYITHGGDFLPFSNGQVDIGAGTARVRNINAQTLSLSSYATMGAIVAADPGSAYYSFNHRIGGNFLVRGTSVLTSDIGGTKPSTFPAPNVQLMVYNSTNGQPITNEACARLLIATDAKQTGAQGYHGTIDFGSSDCTASGSSAEFNYRCASIMCRGDGDTSSSAADGDLQFFTKQANVGLMHRFDIAPNGTLTGTDTNGIGSLSDQRLKTNIQDYTYDLNKFKQLKTRTFDWINPKFHEEGNIRGFIAQEIETVDPYWNYQFEVSKENAEEDYDLLSDGDENYTIRDHRPAKASKLNGKDAMYVSVIQQLMSKIETLEAKVAALEG